MSPHAAQGHAGGYKECREPDCLAHRRRYLKRYYYERAHGRTRMVDTAEARRRVLTLLGLDWSVRAIAGAADLSPAVICRLRDGQPRANRITVARILAIDPNAVPFKPTSQTTEPFVSSLGTRRRIQALLWMGWGYDQIKAHSGLANPAVILHQQGRWVTRSTHDKIAAVYDDLAMKPGPSSRARTWARKLGYAPPLAWDDIDNDPAPNGAEEHDEADEAVDEAAVLRRIDGDRVRLTAAERLEVVRRLHARGLNDGDIARQSGVHQDQVSRDRKALGLPVNTEESLAHLYDPRAAYRRAQQQEATAS